MLVIEIDNKIIPASIIAGKPTAKIFKAGAARVITPIPKLINKSVSFKDEKKNIRKYQQIKKTINKYQKFIKNNFDYVGENFAYEARSIHYNNKKRDKGIYGTASKKDIKELKEEGIDAHLIPWVENKNN